MMRAATLTELSIVVVAHNHNPTVLNPDFLAHNKIVPPDWELSERPFCADPFAQVVYKNGITINTQPARLTFTEELAGRPIEESLLPAITRQYVTTLRHVDYHSVGINPKGHVPMADRPSVRAAVLKLVAAGPWTKFRSSMPQPYVGFSYELPGVSLNIRVEGATVGSDPAQDVVLFSGNLHHDLKGDTSPEKVADLQKVLDSFGTDCRLFGEWVAQAVAATI